MIDRSLKRFLRMDGVVIERLTECNRPVVCLVTASMIGPWIHDKLPFCRVTLTPRVYIDSGHGYIESVMDKPPFGVEDIFPDRAMCAGPGQNPVFGDKEVEGHDHGTVD